MVDFLFRQNPDGLMEFGLSSRLHQSRIDPSPAQYPVFGLNAQTDEKVGNSLIDIDACV
jgi:hypothetical protein